jgi:hypothetical protein
MAAWSAKVSTRALFARVGSDSLHVVQYHHAQKVLALEDRYRKDCTHRLKIPRPVGVFWIGQDIGNVDRSTFEGGAGGGAMAPGPNGISLYEIPKLWRSIESHHHAQQLAVETEDERAISFTQPNRTFGHGIKYGADIECRATDHLQHIGGGGLLFQRLGEITGSLAQLIKQPDVFNGNQA